jgi:hypothetical protein
LIQKLWDISWDLWEHRIGIVHTRENKATLHNMMAVDQEIRTQFIRGPNSLHQCDHHLFDGPLQDILNALIFYRQRWLHRIEIARDRASQRLLTTYSTERQALRTWLQLFYSHPILNVGFLFVYIFLLHHLSFYYRGSNALEIVGDIKAFGH